MAYCSFICGLLPLALFSVLSSSCLLVVSIQSLCHSNYRLLINCISVYSDTNVRTGVLLQRGQRNNVFSRQNC